MSITPSIYVACLAAYNNGFLHGQWMDATQEPDEIKAGISKMLAASPVPNAEEYAIHDYEGFETVQISEYHGIDEVHELANFVEENGLLGAELYNHFNSLNEAKTYLEENYSGFYDSIEDYARELNEQTTEIPQSLQFYIDYEKMARDIKYSGDILTIEAYGGVHVFWK